MALQPIGDGAITIAIAAVIRFAVAIKGCSAQIKYKNGIRMRRIWRMKEK